MASSSASIPKNHHFIAQMHARRFTDKTGNLWAYSKKGSAPFYTSPKAIFAETHLYTTEAMDGTKEASLEASFSQLEGKANDVIDKLVASARLGKAPAISADERRVWDEYFLLQWQRVPDMHAKLGSLSEADTFLDKTFAALRARGPAEAAEVDKLDTLKERRRLIQGGKVKAISTASASMLDVFASRGLVLLRVTEPGESFAIGSLPIIRKKGDLRDAQSEVWLPIASDVAVGLQFGPGVTTVVDLSDPKEVWHINQVTAGQSTTFAAASKSLVERLIDALPKASLI